MASREKKSHRITLFILFLLLHGCGYSLPKSDSKNNESSDQSPEDIPQQSKVQSDSEEANASISPEESKEDDKPAIDGPAKTARTPCSTSWERPLTNLKMEDIVVLINSLPKPVTIPCVLDVLPRPYAVNATTSDLSVQPGEGLDYPRIFISLDFLIITFTTAPGQSSALEFSQLLSDEESVKGEIAFPVTETLSASAPYLQVARSGVNGTRCAGCHFGERAASSPFPENSYVSRALRPFDRQNVSFEMLKVMSMNCGSEISDRCDMLNSLFRGGDPKLYDFPKTMPTLF